MGYQMSEPNQIRDTDERYLPRWETENRVLYQLENSVGIKEGVTKDLNCAGTCIRAKTDITIGQKVKMTIYLEDKTAVTVHGTVCWVKPDRDAVEQQIGVNFYNTPESVQDVILEHAFELNDMKLANHWFRDWNK